MRALMPLAVLALAACDPPLEELWPARFYSFQNGGIVYEARTQYDPFERGWFVRVTSLERPLGARDLALATAVAEDQVGPLVCGGARLDVEPGEVWNPQAGEQVMLLEGPNTWQLVGRCTDDPPSRVPAAVFPEAPPSPEGASVAVVVGE